MLFSYPTVIILYYPDISLLKENIEGVIQAGTNEILLVDNTDGKPFDVSILGNNLQNKVNYIWNGKNLGIASALNIGCSILYEKGYKWALTLDQDSVVPTNIFDVYNTFLITPNTQNKKIAILSCNHLKDNEKEGDVNTYESRDLCITSGCLMSLDAWNKVGKFDEKLFIDGVDHDLCIKLRLNGYKLMRFPYLRMKHKLGEPKTVSVFGHRINIQVGHSPMRMFYMTRNWNYLDNKYKEQLNGKTGLNLSYWKMIIIALLFGKQRLAYLVSFYMGYRDFRNGVFRTYNEMVHSNRFINAIING